MTERENAEAHLRVIRSLMERATIYRMVSAPSALVGGTLAVSTGLFLMKHSLTHMGVTALWVVVAAVVAGLNLVILWREARLRGEPFISSGMKVAVRALAPSFLLTALITALLPDSEELPMVWTTGYALGLLATGHFAPRSMVWLGRAFFVASVGVIVALSREWLDVDEDLYMVLTFGLLHLVYAACTWRRRNRP